MISLLCLQKPVCLSLPRTWGLRSAPHCTRKLIGSPFCKYSLSLILPWEKNRTMGLCPLPTWGSWSVVKLASTCWVLQQILPPREGPEPGYRSENWLKVLGLNPPFFLLIKKNTQIINIKSETENITTDTIMKRIIWKYSWLLNNMGIIGTDHLHS